MNIHDLPAAFYADVQRTAAVGIRRNQTGIGATYAEPTHAITIEEGIRSLDTVSEKSAPPNSPTRSMLENFVRSLHNLSSYPDRHWRRAPDDELPLDNGIPPEFHASICYAAEFTQALRLLRSSNRGLRLIGQQAYNEAYKDLSAVTEELQLQYRVREKYVQAYPNRADDGTYNAVFNTQAAALLATSQPDPAELHRLWDQCYSRWLLTGISRTESHAFEPEMDDDLHTALAGKFGEMVSTNLTAALKEHNAAALNRATRVEEPHQIAQKAKRMTEFRRKLVAFRGNPTLKRWQAFAKAAVAECIEGVRAGQFGMVAQAVVMLDPATKTFAHCMTLINDRQADYQTALERAELAFADIAVGSSSASRATSRAKATKNKKSRTAKNLRIAKRVPAKHAAREPADTNDVITPAAEEILKRIEAAAGSAKPADALEGAVGKLVHENLSAFADIVGFNQKIARADHSVLGELDLHLDHAIIECTLKAHGKEHQLNKYLDDRRMNPERKAVVLYAENYVGEVPKGVYVAKNPDQLADILFVVKARKLGWGKNEKSPA